MLKPFTIISLVGVTLVLALLVLMKLPGIAGSRQRIEVAASQALQLDTRIHGPVSISLSHGLQLTLDDVHISADGPELLSAKRARLRLALLPLLTGKIRLLSLTLDQPHIELVRAEDDSVNFNLPQAQQGGPNMPEIAEIFLTDASLSYLSTPSQLTLAAQSCEIQIRQLQLNAAPGTTILHNISFQAQLSCAEFALNTYSGTDLGITVAADNGVIDLAPVTMRVSGGQGSGSLQADFSEATPRYQVNYELQKLELTSLFNGLPAELSAEGLLDLHLSLILQGDNPAALTRSASGALMLHGTNLTLAGIDLDEKFKEYESSQNFDLVDVGAFFLAGPLGLLATKGYDFTSLMVQNGGSSEISSLVSDWLIEDGVARASDVAMATTNNRIALRGMLDFVNDEFVDVSMALVDRDGCSVVQQEIGGSLTQPEIERPNIVTTIAGPLFEILHQGVALLTDQQCDVFYAGIVTAP